MNNGGAGKRPHSLTKAFTREIAKGMDNRMYNPISARPSPRRP
jgi:hypothetical protein